MKRRDFFKVVTGFVAGVCAAFVPKAEGGKRSCTRPTTNEDRVAYCAIHSCNQCPFNGDRCMIDIWKETPLKKDWKGRSAKDICNEALGKINGRKIANIDPNSAWAKEMTRFHNIYPQRLCGDSGSDIETYISKDGKNYILEVKPFVVPENIEIVRKDGN